MSDFLLPDDNQNTKPIDICNMALDVFGEKNIADIDDTTNLIAITCKKYYDEARKEMFERFDFPYSRDVYMERAILPPQYFHLYEEGRNFGWSTDPEDGKVRLYTKEYPYPFAVPNKCKKIIRCYNKETLLDYTLTDWTRRYVPEMGQQIIVSKHKEMMCEYEFDVEAIELWPAVFKKLVAHNLATKIVFKITRDVEKRQFTEALFEKYLQDATLKDLNENAEPNVLWENDFIRSRGRNNDNRYRR